MYINCCSLLYLGIINVLNCFFIHTLFFGWNLRIRVLAFHPFDVNNNHSNLSG